MHENEDTEWYTNLMSKLDTLNEAKKVKQIWHNECT